MGIFKGFENEIVAAGLTPAGGAEDVGAVVERFVDDIPHGDAATIATGHGIDMGFHAGEEEFLAGGFFAIAEEPGRGAIVLGPDEAVADHRQAVGGGKSDERIGESEVEAAFSDLDGIGLETIFGGDAGELGEEKGPILRALGDAIGNANANGEEMSRS